MAIYTTTDGIEFEYDEEVRLGIYEELKRNEELNGVIESNLSVWSYYLAATAKNSLMPDSK
jgi:hypothetical protein